MRILWRIFCTDAAGWYGCYVALEAAGWYRCYVARIFGGYFVMATSFRLLMCGPWFLVDAGDVFSGPCGRGGLSGVWGLVC